MAVSFLPIILMFLGSSGGFNELLDLTDPISYLEAQGIEYKVEALVELLAEPRSQDLEKVKAQEVKKLQAMRALGRLKDQSALPALRKAAESNTLFFDDYALSAIAAIEGKKNPRKGASAEQLKSDLALLPEGVGMVVQLRLDAGEPLNLKNLIKQAVKGIPNAPDPDELLTQLNAQLGQVLAMVGNVRVDAVTLGLSEDIDDDSGFIMIIGRGKYDHRTFESLMAEQNNTTHHQIGGTMFLGMDGDDVALAPVSSDRLIMVAGPGWESFPLAKVAAKLKARPAEPVFSERLKKLIARTNQKGALWGAGLVSDGMRVLPPVAPFEEVVISTEIMQESGQSKMKVEGVGSDPKAVGEAIAQMKGGVEQGVAEIEQSGQPGMEPLLKVMKGLKFYSMGLNGTITATFDENPANLVSLLVPIFGVRMDQAAPPP